jgi:hypothetical protein
MFLYGLALGSDEFIETVSFSIEDLEVTRLHGHDFIRLKDGVPSAAVGFPALPVVQKDVALPWNAEVLGVSLVDVTTVELDGVYQVAPMTEPRIIESQSKEEDPFVQDPAIYESDEAFPGIFVQFKGTWDLVGQRMAKLAFHPVQYNPSTGKLTLATSITFRLLWDELLHPPTQTTCNLTSQGSEYYEDLLERRSLNPVSIPPYIGSGSRALPSGQFEHVIITPQAFESDWSALVQWRTRKGHPSNVVTREYIYANYSGTDVQKIRAFVVDAHSTWGARFFLIGADGGTGSLEVPYHVLNRLGDDIANDTYYGDYDSDWVVDVHVGRASVTSATEIGQFIDKVLYYEKTPAMTGYGKKVLFLGFDLDDVTDGEDTKIMIDGSDIPSYINLLTEYDSESGGHVSDVIAYLNDGPNLVNHIDHCNWNVWGMGYTNHSESMVDTDVIALANGWDLINIYTLGCLASAWNYGESLSETFMRKAAGGGVSFTGNTMYGWYAVGYPDLYSSLYEMCWWHVLFADNQYHAGEALTAHKNDYYPDDEYYEYIFTELNLLGDPAMPFWKDDPGLLSVTCDDPIYTGSQGYTVHVQEGGSNLSGAMVCLWKGSEVYQFDTTNASGLASFFIEPLTAGTMWVTATAQDCIPNEGGITVELGNPPDITDVTPDDGPVAGGTACTIIGSDFTTTPDTTVLFGGAAAGSVNVVDANTITCNSPAHTAGSVDVEVSTSLGSDTLPGGFTYHNAPDIVAVSPDNGSQAGGTAVTVSGNDFTAVGTTHVFFDGLGASNVVVVDSMTITCTTPAHGPGSVDVEVTNDFGSDTLAGGYTYNAPPELTGASPAHGPVAGGTPVTLSGNYFTSTADTNVYFDAIAASNVAVLNSTTITCESPAHAAGSVDIEVVNSNGSDILIDGFFYHNPPNLTSVDPDQGPATGGTAVTLTGSDFTSLGTTAVTFDVTPATNVVVVSSSTITCTTPAHGPGQVDVTVTNDFGSHTLPNGFNYTSAPEITGVDPDNGPVVGGTAVTISGNAFTTTPDTDVLFGGDPASNVIVVDSSTITCLTPVHTPGLADVEVSNSNGSDILPNGYLYNYPPEVLTVDPAHGPVAGGTPITVTGNHFTTSGDTHVYFGAVEASNVVVLNANTLTCDSSPHSAGTVYVEVSNNNGSDVLLDCFTYHDPPILASITPSVGFPLTAIPVTISGSNFTTLGNPQLFFGGLPATSVIVVDSSTITCETPVYPIPDIVDLELVTDFGSYTMPNSFAFLFQSSEPPKNLTDVDTLDLHPGNKVRHATSGPGGAVYILFLSFGGGPVNTMWGPAGLDMPVYYLLSGVLNGLGFHTITLNMPHTGMGFVNFYTHALVDASPPVWAEGGNNPNGTGSIMWGLN